MSRRDAQAQAVGWLEDGGFEAALAALVAIPSESQTERGLAYCHAYLDALGARLTGLGFVLRRFDNPKPGRGPALLAERHEGDDLPTVLGYGHGDVVHGMEARWSKGRGPWTLAREGDRLYGRGTADNKGQHLINLAAMEAVLATRGRLGFNAKVMIETGEETGSPGLRELISTNRDSFAADLLIASDGPRVHPDRPTVSLGCRGAVNFDLVCHLRDGAHHSGNWGGALADPAAVLAHAIACIVTPRGEILVPEWRPPPIRPLVRELLAGVSLDGGDGGPAVEADWGEPGLSPAERVYAWNSFAVLAMTAGTPEAPVNAIAASARAHCQLRFIAGTPVDDILPALRRHLDRAGFGGRIAVVEDAREDGFAASRTEPDHPWAVWVRSSVEKSAGTPPAVVPQMGGSICNELFTDLLGIPAVWLPHSYAGCAQHAPDEHVLLPVCRSALSIMAGLYWDLGEGSTPA